MKKMAVTKKLIFTILMVAVYLGMGSLLIFSRIFDVDRTLGIIIGVLMMLYGVFRGIRMFRGV